MLRRRITRYLKIKSKYFRGPQKMEVGVNCEENMPLSAPDGGFFHDQHMKLTPNIGL